MTLVRLHVFVTYLPLFFFTDHISMVAASCLICNISHGKPSLSDANQQLQTDLFLVPPARHVCRPRFPNYRTEATGADFSKALAEKFKPPLTRWVEASLVHGSLSIGRPAVRWKGGIDEQNSKWTVLAPDQGAWRCLREEFEDFARCKN